MKDSIKKIFWLIAFMFFLIIIWLGKLSIIDREKLIINPYNPRLQYIDDSIKRGSIKDANKNAIAYSEYTKYGYVRKYPYSEKASHITGYLYNGKAGIESSKNFNLETIHNEVLQRIYTAFSSGEIKGDDVILTIDMDIQSLAYDLLGDKKGAIVVIEPKTGKVIAMQSYPNFNPNTIYEDWEKINTSEESPLINRAIQGLYPPASTFKLITAVAIMEYLDEWKDFEYECRGSANFGSKNIHCYNSIAHGVVNINKAIENSCNTYFAELIRKVGGKNLRSVADRFMINSQIDFDLPLKQNSFVVDKNVSESELIETAIGQGKTLVTPMYMAMVVSAIANDGIMKKPYIVDYIQHYNGKISDKNNPETLANVMSYEEAQIIKDMMLSVVNNGTGKEAYLEGYDIAGKTGTAQNVEEFDHSWFIGFAPYENPQVAVSVILENSNDKASPIARDIIKAVIDKKNN